MLDGYQGMITAPEGFERVMTDAKRLEVFPDLRNGPAVLARAHAQPSGAADSSAIPVAFLSETGEPLLTCSVHIVPFDPARHSLARMKVGNCDLKLVAGLPQLRVGHLQAWRLPSPSEGNPVSPKRIMEMMTLDEDLIMPSGNSPGIAVMSWVPRGQSGIPQVNLCPMETVDATDANGPLPIPDDALCKDPQGKPLRLKPGQVATVQAHNPDGSVFATQQYMTQQPAVAKAIGFDKTLRGPTIEAVAPGSTSVALLAGHNRHIVAQVCEVVVE